MNDQLNQHKSSNSYFLVLVDIFMTLLACNLAFLIVLLTEDKSDELALSAHFGAIAIMLLIAVLVTAVLGLYDNRRAIFSWGTLRHLVSAWFIIASAVALVAVVTKTNYTYSRLWFLLSMSLSFALIVCCRIYFNNRSVSAARRIMSKRDVLAIGAGSMFEKTVNRLIENNIYPYRQVLMCRWKNEPEHTNSSQLTELNKLITNAKIDQLWIIGSELNSHAAKIIVEHFRSELMQINYFPDFSFLPIVRPELGSRAGLPVVRLSVDPLRPADQWLKALFDKLFSFVVLILLSPILLILAVGVKLSSPGPVLYRQERLSIYGKSFMMLKFRSMPISAEQESGPVWAKKGEQRATKFGGFLRKTSLDELPQFINVLRGEMSVVGPRPERPFFVEQFQTTVPAYMQKHYVKAGITGWAQVNGLRGNTSIDERIEHDIFYIQNWSIWLDVKIIFMTFFKGFISETAY